MWQKIKYHSKEIWTGARIGLLIGFIIGYAIAFYFHIEPKEKFNLAVLIYAQRGLFLGTIIGVLVKLCKLWRERKNGGG